MGSRWEVGDGSSMDFGFDPWKGQYSLQSLLTEYRYPNLHITPGLKISEAMSKDSDSLFLLNAENSSQFPLLKEAIGRIHLNNRPDWLLLGCMRRIEYTQQKRVGMLIGRGGGSSLMLFLSGSQGTLPMLPYSKAPGHRQQATNPG